MQIQRHALLCSTLLFATPWLAAQALQPTIARPGEQTIQVAPGVVARIWQDGAFTRSALSRDGGKTWTGLRNVDARVGTPWQTFDPLAGEPMVPATLPTPATNQLRIVQAATQILPEYPAALAALGIEIYNYLPEQGYLVRANAQQEAALRGLPWVRWVGEWKLPYKFEPAILDDLLAGKEMPATRLVIMLFDRRADRTALVNLIEEVGGTIDIAGDHPGAENCLLEATLTGAQMLKVAAANTVVWIERWNKPTVDMNNARAVAGADYIQAAGGFTGKGVRGHIMEGIQASHPEFVATPPYRTLPIGLFNTTADAHGCATFGEVFSKGVVAQARGMCPDGQGLFTNYNYVYSGSGTGVGTRYYVYQQLTDPLLTNKAMQQTASWGYTQNIVYDARAVEMDLGIFTFDLPTTQSQSNTGNRNSRPQAWAKNIISVGAHYHFDNQVWTDDRWSSGASIGPAPDNRIKPDLCAFYDATYTTYSTASGYDANFGGTSGATPMVNGMLGLAQEMYTDGLFGHVFATTGWQNRFENRAHFTTMKGLLINTTRQYDPAVNVGTTRYNQGWGFPQLNTIYDERSRLLVLNEDDTLLPGATRSYFVWAPGGKTLRTTMVYSDPAGTAGVNPNRVNDLDLKVTTSNGTVYWGNNGLAAGLYSTVGGAPNTLDTVENVWIQNAPRGWYKIDVNASLIAVDQHKETAALDADFALIASGIGGLRDTTGLKLALTSASTGDFRVDLTNLPASYSEGFTIFSVTTPRPVSFGNFFGIEFDGLSNGCLTSTVGAGNVFHFSPSTTTYPATTYAFNSALAAALTGVTFDAVAFTVDASGAINAMSNAARVKLQ